MSLLNITKNAKLTFSSTSQWSTDKDSREISKIEIFIDESKNSGAIFDKQSIQDKLKYNTLFLSFGENCLTDNILDRNNLKNFTTPYSHGRSNIEYILKIEKDNFKNFLNNDAWDYKKTREGKNAPVLYADAELHNKYDHTQGFELTHHDIISDKEILKTITRRCERLLNLKNYRIFIFYHHRLCAGSSEELLIADLLELKKIYQKRGNEVDIIMFQQIIIDNIEDRKVLHQLKNGIHIYNFYTLNQWSGGDLDIFWAKCDDDLIDIMINSVKSLIKL